MSLRFDHELMKLDAVSRGWSGSKLAARARVAQFTVSRFFRGGVIRPETAKKLSAALKQPLERYIVSDAAPAVELREVRS